MVADLPLADELAVVAARMSGLLLSRETVQSALDIVAVSAAEAIRASSGAGVSLLDEEDGRTTAAASDEVVRQADDLQYALGEGPCLAAWAGRALVRVDDVLTDHRWPRWGPAAAEIEMRSAVSAPLFAGDACLGAVKVYAREPGAFSARDERLLTLFAEQAGILVANMRSYEDARRVSAHFREVLRNRDVLNMAKGVLMERESVSEEVAFGVLLGLAGSDRQQASAVALSLLRQAEQGSR
ncbi:MULTISPECIES: GAF and ANTAR domain-containing protein [Amycolatopsis]|uniref:GAF and ANTAR domain-containing protein n=1 Tax=Amycolatopsis TaxID=1813 RepID=UPI001748F636|nr:GAF and ANTAR domain-containing protein [Amycolatopsis bullii]